MLIGDAHWLSDGRHKEEILRALISRFLPGSFGCSSGFIVSLNQDDQVSPESDIIVFNKNEYQPLFQEGDLLIAPPAGVSGFIQSKSKFSKATLLKAIGNLAATRSIMQFDGGGNAWYGIVFSSVGDCETLDSISDCVSQTLLDHESIVAKTPERFRKSLSTEQTSFDLTIAIENKFLLRRKGMSDTIRCHQGDDSIAKLVFDLLHFLGEQWQTVPSIYNIIQENLPSSKDIEKVLSRE